MFLQRDGQKQFQAGNQVLLILRAPSSRQILSKLKQFGTAAPLDASTSFSVASTNMFKAIHDKNEWLAIKVQSLETVDNFSYFGKSVNASTGSPLWQKHDESVGCA